MPKRVQMFLLTYRTYLKPVELLMEIIARFRAADSESTQDKNKRIRIFNFLKRWLTEFWNDDFKDEEGVRPQLHQFVDSIKLTPLGKQLGKVVEEHETGKKSEHNVVAPNSVEPPKSRILKSVVTGISCVYPQELAR